MAHWMDRIAGGIMQSRRLVPRLFPGGWGDTEVFPRYAAYRRSPPPPRPVRVVWARSPDLEGGWVGRFETPSLHLPSGARSARALWLGRDCRRQVLLLAASNDHTWKTRLAVAWHLLDAEIGSLLLENPYYGERRVRSGQPLDTVADFFRMGAATVAEARSLLLMLGDLGHTPGVAGFSQGGSVAAYTSAISPVAVATTCLAAGPSPSSVFTSGVLASSIDWEALGGRESALPRLRDLLDDVTVLRYEPAPHTAAAVVAGGRTDGYVAADDVRRLAGHWVGSELIWLDGGHASFHFFGRRLQARFITRSFHRFDRHFPPDG